MPLHVYHRRALLAAQKPYRVARAGPAVPWTNTQTGNATSPEQTPTSTPAEATRARPTARMILAGFRQIPHAAALSGDSAATLAWFCLRRHVVRTADEQFALTGYKADLRSPRTADLGAAKLWASAGGFDAFLVIGRNLRFLTPDAWVKADGPALPFVTGALTGRTALPATQPNDGQVISVLTFPSGAFADAAPGKEVTIREFGLEAFPFVQRDSLDVALVVQASRVASGVATNYVDGYAHLELKTADVYRSREYA